MVGRPRSDSRCTRGDRVVLDGRDVTRLLAVERNLQVILYHKPTGEMLRRRAGDEREGIEMHLPALHAGRWVAINALGYGEDGLLHSRQRRPVRAGHRHARSRTRRRISRARAATGSRTKSGPSCPRK